MNNPNHRPGQPNPETNTQPGKRPEERERDDMGRGSADRNEQRSGGQGQPGQGEPGQGQPGQRQQPGQPDRR